MLLGCLLLAASHLAGPVIAARKSVSISAPAPIALAAPLVVSSNVLTLTRKTPAKGYNSRSAAYLMGLATIPSSNHTTTLTSLFIGEEFATDITFGTQTFQSTVDTGSSDTWVVETGFQCVDISSGSSEPESDCDFGPAYTVSNTFSQTPNENFNITYGDGEFLTGIIGSEEITLAGLQVNQTIAVVNYAAWQGDGTTSGLIGLAYPSITSAYAGTNPKLDNSPKGEQIQYSPIFQTISTEGLVPSMFSLAILRNVSGPSGYLALGGVPPIDFVQNFTSTPILVTSISGYPKALDFYTIATQEVVLNGKNVKNSAGIKFIVDSGTTLNYFPTSVANSVNAAFSPAAKYSDADGAYVVNCNAKPPTLGVTINGTTFYTNPLDMILDAGTDSNGKEICITGINDGGSSAAEDVYILGDTFQKNVVSVFDIGAGMMRFAEREYYPSNDPVKI